ncbi:short-chain dehydrogenase/reductase SDR [Cutibacterium acnes JCM 18918]|nr:short-chain dehydrogenase/reductase SDR [Cutibacterium acnes JCM 18918]
MNDMEATRDERPWALVSGASGGLGQAFSRHLPAAASTSL